MRRFFIFYYFCLFVSFSDLRILDRRFSSGLKTKLFLDSHDRIFGTIFRQSRTVLRFGFAPRTDVFGFCGVF